MDAVTFKQRRSTCRACPHWQGVCGKGHALAGDLGCPLQKFSGINGAGFLPDAPAQPVVLPARPDCTTCRSVAAEMKPLTWPEVFRHLRESLQSWREHGFPLASQSDYQARLHKCQNCPKGQYQWFQCRHCRCVVYTKAMLATETCPYGVWPV